MKKMYEIIGYVYTYFPNWRGKLIPRETNLWGYVMAENKEQARQEMLKSICDSSNEYFKEIEFSHIQSWDEWKVERALKQLNGKQFKEWAEQQGLNHLFEQLKEKRKQ